MEYFRDISGVIFYSFVYVTMLDDKIKKANEYVIEDYKNLQFWKVEPSSSAKNCRNFIREVVDNLDLQPNPEKPVIALSIGEILENK